MNQIAKLAGSALLGCALSAPAWALTITGGAFDGVEVGALDPLISTTDTLPNSSPATETGFVSTTLGGDAAFLGKTDDAPLFAVAGDPDYFAVQLSSDPGYYLIKNATWWALFQNVASLAWGVFDSGLLPAGMNIGDTTVSHVAGFNADGDTDPFIPQQVPVPGSLLLLGVGLFAAAGVQRRRGR